MQAQRSALSVPIHCTPSVTDAQAYSLDCSPGSGRQRVAMRRTRRRVQGPLLLGGRESSLFYKDPVSGRSKAIGGARGAHIFSHVGEDRPPTSARITLNASRSRTTAQITFPTRGQRRLPSG